MIAIIDYGMGNLRSVQAGLEYVGQEAFVTDDPEKIVDAPAVVLPGVGAFGDAARSSRRPAWGTLFAKLCSQGNRASGSVWGCNCCFQRAKKADYIVDWISYPVESHGFRRPR